MQSDIYLSPSPKKVPVASCTYQMDPNFPFPVEKSIDGEAAGEEV